MMPVPAPSHLVLADRQLDLSRTTLMAVLNATPDSFSDAGLYDTLEARVARAGELVEQGADVIDVGGQSGITNVAELHPDEEIERVAPLIERIRADHPDIAISIDTYKPAVADAALGAGASLVNDTSGLLHPETAEVVARHRAGLVIMHNRSRPKQRLTDPALYADLIGDIRSFLAERIEVAVGHGVDRASIVVDPGPDFSKSPFHTVQLLRHLDATNPGDFPMLLAVSRKDFIGALTQTAPDDRLEGTLATVAHVAGPGRMLRVHDVLAVKRFLAVFDVLQGSTEIAEDLQLDPSLYRTARSEARNPATRSTG